jgi:hypothetical protein
VARRGCGFDQNFGGGGKSQRHRGLLADADTDGIRGILPPDDRYDGARRQTLPLDEAEECGVLVQNLGDPLTSPRGTIRQTDPPRFLNLAAGGGNRIAVGIHLGASQQRIDPLQYALGDGMFQIFRFRIHHRPIQPEHLHQE